MYSLAEYGLMMADRVRLQTYTAALRKAIRPGAVVVDLGAGPGILSFIALQSGALKVYAIDPSATLEVARQLARKNGFENNTEFFRAQSEDVTLPERADVLVFDLHGVLPPFGKSFQVLADARRRFLKPTGVLIPQRDVIWISLVEAPRDYDGLLAGWSSDNLDLSMGRHMVANTWTKCRIEAAQVLSNPAKWVDIDYSALSELQLGGEIRPEIRRPGTAHGLAVWFDTFLAEDIVLSNAPDKPRAIYGQAFFPFIQPIHVEPGFQVQVAMRADLVDDDYHWTWNTVVQDGDGTGRADFKQSTFFAIPLSPEFLRKRADSYPPFPNQDAMIDGQILSMFGSGATLREISAAVAKAFPNRFEDWKALMNRVASLSTRYSV